MGRQGGGRGSRRGYAGAVSSVCFLQQDFIHSLRHLLENAIWPGLGLDVVAVSYLRLTGPSDPHLFFATSRNPGRPSQSKLIGL